MASAQPCSRNAEASACIDTLPGSLVLLCDKQIFFAVNRVSCTWTCTLSMSGSPSKYLCMYTTGRGSLNNAWHLVPPMQAAHMRGTRHASVHAQAGKTSKVTCLRQRMRGAGHAVAMQSTKAECRLIKGDQSRSKIERTTTTVQDGRQWTWPTTRLMGLAQARPNKPNTTNLERDLQRPRLRRWTIDRQRRMWTPSAGLGRSSWLSFFFLRLSNNFKFAFLALKVASQAFPWKISICSAKIDYVLRWLLSGELATDGESSLADRWSRCCITAAADWTERAARCPARTLCQARTSELKSSPGPAILLDMRTITISLREILKNQKDGVRQRIDVTQTTSWARFLCRNVKKLESTKRS